MSESKHIVLITGANCGIGFELARQLLADPSKHVLLGSRSADKGEAAVEKLRAEKPRGTVELLQVDVSSEDSIRAAAEAVRGKHGRLDALVNNAGIAVPGGSVGEQMQQCFLTNATGPAIMGYAFQPLLEKAVGTARVLNVSSGGGSIAGRLDPKHPMYGADLIQYRASKAALNMVSAGQSVSFGRFGAKVFAYCPGFTESNLSDKNKAEYGARSAADSVRPMVEVLNGSRDKEHGGFLHAFPEGQYQW